MSIILDLYAGKGGEDRRDEIEALGHKYTTVDNDPKFNCNITVDIMTIKDLNEIGRFDFVWASVPCESWSVAAIGHHWQGGKNAYIPKSEKSKYMIGLVKHTLELIKNHNPKTWVMENPVGMLRMMDFMQPYKRQDIHYCQYGENRMKPTDIWSAGLNWQPRPKCKRGDPCHAAAPCGSRTGTQGMKNYAEKSVVPLPLWVEILEAANK